MKKIFFLILGAMILISVQQAARAQAADLKRYPAAVVQNGHEKWGYIDSTGNMVIQPAYDHAGDFTSQGVAVVATESSQYGQDNVSVIDRNGITVFGPMTSSLPEYSDGFLILQGKSGGGKVLDAFGKLVLDSPYRLYDYTEGLIRFSQMDTAGKTELFGYMDLTGKVVIPAQYLYAEAFHDWVATVKTKDGKYFSIDKTGATIRQLKDYSENQTSDGLSVYWDDVKGTYGYKSTEGKVVVEAQFNRADRFKNGFAVVEVPAGEYQYKLGLINKKGEYVLKPEYSGITDIGNGLYAVSQQFYAMNSDQFAPKAIVNSKGEKITDYLYYSVDPFEGDYASVCDDTTSFFIDTKGNRVESLPRLKGIGSMHILGDVIQARLDNGMMYVDKKGAALWKQDRTQSLGDGFEVKTISYRQDFCTYVEYPEIQGVKDSEVQEKINASLESLFIGGYPTTGGKEDDAYTEDDYTDFTAERNKDLLVIEKSGYYYPIGAAHGSPSQEYYFINLKSGAFYSIKDLFRSNSSYLDRLTTLVQKQIQLDNRIGTLDGTPIFMDTSPEVAADQGFYIGEDGLVIYFQPYEISSYASGFPEFVIPFGQLMDVLDTKGDFWNSFDKTMIDQKTKWMSDYVGADIQNQTETLMKAYETGIISAINSNDFKKVQGSLATGSSLFTAQKNLVQSLNKQKVQEKLNGYHLYALDYDSTIQTFQIFVIEDVGIKYPGKSFVSKSYYWCYSAKQDPKTGKLLLRDIRKW